MDKKDIVINLSALIIIILAGAVWYTMTTKNVLPVTSLEYTNTQYGFRFSLPATWEGYSIVTDTWQGHAVDSGGEILAEEGPMISIRHPQWTAQKPRQDIPIMVFTTVQWNALQQGEFNVGAAPIGPRELGRNDLYVLALPARYNYAFPIG